jgi:spore coat polysaccharide biosynthesis predicted glycosyltransferase SpsG
LKKTYVFFKVDANDSIGTGHLFRCRLLARGLRRYGVNSIFLTFSTSPALLSELIFEGFEVKSLSTEESKDPEAILKYVKEYQNSESILVVDSDGPAFYTEDFQHEVRCSDTRLMMITFKHEHHYLADLIHNQSLVALRQEYPVEGYTKLLLGPRYAILADGGQNESDKKSYYRFN